MTIRYSLQNYKPVRCLGCSKCSAWCTQTNDELMLSLCTQYFLSMFKNLTIYIIADDCSLITAAVIKEQGSIIWGEVDVVHAKMVIL